MTHEVFDPDEIDEMHDDLRDYLLASDLVAVLTQDDEGGLEELVANLYRVVRHSATSLQAMALVLRRIPESRERIADGLDELAGALNELVLRQESPDAG
jgi:hypothetical protein